MRHELSPHSEEHSKKVFELVSNHIGYNWRELYRELAKTDFLETENVIRTIQHRHLGSLRDQARECLMYLKLNQMSICDLVYGLKKCQMIYLAELVEEIK